MKLSFRKLGQGKPLFIMHGLFGSADNWQTLGKGFAEHFTVYLIDLRNHGQSPHVDESNYRVMSEDIKELADDEGLDKIMLIGHSMGGKVAMQFAVTHPERVEKLVVVDIGPKKYPVTNQFIIDAIDTLDLPSFKNRKEVDEKLTPLVPDFGTRQFLLKNLYWTDDQRLDWKFNYPVLKQHIKAVGEVTPIPASPVEAPTLFIKGEKSDYIFPSDEKLISAMFPNSSIITIAGAGHWVHADKPQEFFKETMEFLMKD